jgi:hypothetical protein
MDILSEFKRILDALLHSVSVTSILLLRLRMKRLLLQDCLDEWIPEAAMFFCSEKKLDRRHCCLLCKHLQSQVGIFFARPRPCSGSGWPRWWVVTGVWREAEHHTTGSANWRKIKWKKAEGGGDRHQKERKRVQGDAGTDLVCSCDPCLLEWRVFLASSRCCYMAGRPAFSSFSTLLCPTPRPDAVSSSWCLDLLWPGQPPLSPFDPASARLAGLDAWWFIMCLVGYTRKNEMRRIMMRVKR